jgi:hypothetical protein
MVIVMRKFIEIESVLGSKYIIPIDSIFCVFEDKDTRTVEIYLKHEKSDEIHIESKTPYEEIKNFLFN